MPELRLAQADEAESLTALCVRSKAHWGYDAEFMQLSTEALTVESKDIVAGRVLIAVDGNGQPLATASVLGDGETVDLEQMFVDPSAMRQGLGRMMFMSAVRLARKLGARRMTILADPNAAPFYERMGARFVRHAPSDAIPGRSLPFYEYDLAEKGTS
jgi:GNAT superfamily N-acetyltransferase